MDTPVLTCEACGKRMFTDAAYFHTKADCVEVLQARLADAQQIATLATSAAARHKQRTEAHEVTIDTQRQLIITKNGYIDALEARLDAAYSAGAAFLQAGVTAIAAAGAVIFPPRLPALVAFEGEGWVAYEVGVDMATGSDVTAISVCDNTACQVCAAF